MAAEEEKVGTTARLTATAVERPSPSGLETVGRSSSSPSTLEKGVFGVGSMPDQ